MLIIIERLSMFYIFLLLGWIFGRSNKKLVSHTDILSFLLVNLFLPCTIFDNFSSNFTAEYFLNNSSLLIFSTLLLLVLHLICKYPARALSKDLFERKVYEYSFVIPNSAYLGYPLMAAIFGSQGLTDLVLFTIPFAVYTYTYGYMQLSGCGKSIKKLFNPITVSIVLGAIFGLLRIPLPKIVSQTIASTADCVGPLSMLLTGLTLSAMSPKSLVMDKNAYIMVALRLLVIPAAVFALCQIPILAPVLTTAIFYVAMPTGLNTIVFAQNGGKSPELGAKLAFLSHLFSVLTIPLWLMLV